MICFVLGCGETGRWMPDAGHHIIGVNDAFKFNKNLDQLVLINRPRHFKEPAGYVEGVSRLDVIKNSYFFEIITLETLEPEWRAIMPEGTKIRTIRTSRFRKDIQPGDIYHVDSSPFVAMSYAVTKGYSEVVLWGVDFVNHRWLKAETAAPYYSSFASRAEKFGCRIFKGHKDSKLTLPVWQG